MKRLEFKHAFTMVELIFIIIVIGILAAIIIPRSQDTRLREAADQIVSHIRYTQHLALMDDKFSPADADWYKKRWQIFFEENDDNWIYTIYSDNDTDSSADETEIAINPQNPSSRLTGRTAEAYATKSLNLGREYGISDITFADCNGDRIVFDYIGRPMQNDPNGYVRSYINTDLITSVCTITIENSAGQTANITIQPETGFARVIL